MAHRPKPLVCNATRKPSQNLLSARASVALGSCVACVARVRACASVRVCECVHSVCVCADDFQRGKSCCQFDYIFIIMTHVTIKGEFRSIGFEHLSTDLHRQHQIPEPLHKIRLVAQEDMGKSRCTATPCFMCVALGIRCPSPWLVKILGQMFYNEVYDNLLTYMPFKGPLLDDIS